MLWLSNASLVRPRHCDYALLHLWRLSDHSSVLRLEPVPPSCPQPAVVVTTRDAARFISCVSFCLM